MTTLLCNRYTKHKFKYAILNNILVFYESFFFNSDILLAAHILMQYSMSVVWKLDAEYLHKPMVPV